MARRSARSGDMEAKGAAISFWGAAGTVTGSKFLLEVGGSRVLVDCGLFQGPKVWRERNWEAPTFAEGLDAIVLTHAHLDHSGFVPRLLAVRGTADGGRWTDDGREPRHRPPSPVHRQSDRVPWRVYGTPATVDLLRVLWPDSAHIQEEDAAFANKKGFSKHRPALPLYTGVDAYAALRLLRERDYDEDWEAAPGIQARFEDAGHIVGSATARFTLPDGRSVLFSGDLGRYVNPLLRDPAPPVEADVVVVESTYGGRQHSPEPPEEGVAAAVDEVVRHDGVLVIPAFAVGRTQDLLYALRELMVSGCIPELPIYVDSPMAVEATRIFLSHEEAHDPDLYAGGKAGAQRREALRWSAEGGVRYVQTRGESQALNELQGPAIIIASSGMATGGRILHHLKHRLPRRNTVVLLVGYQAEGTRGRLLLDGAPAIKIHGQEVPVHAQVHMVDGFSAHADEAEILRWLGGFTRPPQRLFLVHGEPESRTALARAIQERFGWRAELPEHGERCAL
jgi:metallo-beta-lactamase family protein